MIGTYIDHDPDSVVDNIIALARLYMVDFGNVTGGSLAIVLSDGNLDTVDIRWCQKYAEERADHVGVALAKCLAEISQKQRRDVYDACGEF